MSSRPVDLLSEDELRAVNGAHEWKLHTLDAAGRMVGNASAPLYPIPHKLVLMADERFRLKGRDVVEFGCLEGAHTIALAGLAKGVTALDARTDNLVKAAVRCTLYGVHPKFVQMDVESEMPQPSEIYFHAGVLYHLQDPAVHLRRVGRLAAGLLLDTHYAKPKDAVESYVSADKSKYAYWKYAENVAGSRAGVRDFSRWLTMADILRILRDCYSKVEVAWDRMERKGPRVTILACHLKAGS